MKKFDGAIIERSKQEVWNIFCRVWNILSKNADIFLSGKQFYEIIKVATDAYEIYRSLEDAHE